MKPPPNSADDRDILLEVTDLQTHFPVRSGPFSRVTGAVHAVDGVSLRIRRGETLGLVGESGSGKSTLGKSITRLVEPTAGSVRINGQEVTTLNKTQLKTMRRRVQTVFQDPYSSLNPRLRVGMIVGEALGVHGIAHGPEREEKVAAIFGKVGLRPSDMQKYPNEFSGGQRQRIGIARALVLSPDLIIADEAVSALDVSVQAQVLNLLMDLQVELGLSYLFIAHDLSVVAQICDRIAVMYLGQIVETAQRRDLFSNPMHPYTQSLLASIPVSNPRLRNKSSKLLTGDIPSATNPPTGCRFNTRCSLATDRCRIERPPMSDFGDEHQAACWNA